jgi:hypothetical protein
MRWVVEVHKNVFCAQVRVPEVGFVRVASFGVSKGTALENMLSTRVLDSLVGLYCPGPESRPCWRANWVNRSRHLSSRSIRETMYSSKVDPVGQLDAFFNQYGQPTRPEIRVNFSNVVIEISSIGGWANGKLGDLEPSDCIWKICGVIQTAMHGKTAGRNSASH